MSDEDKVIDYLVNELCYDDYVKFVEFQVLKQGQIKKLKDQLKEKDDIIRAACEEMSKIANVDYKAFGITYEGMKVFLSKPEIQEILKGGE